MSFREFNRQLLDVFDTVMNFIIDTIMIVLSMSPQTFSPEAFNLAQSVGDVLSNVALGLVALFFMIDLSSSTISFRVKEMTEVIKLILMFILGGVFVRASFWLTMYIFANFQGLLNIVMDNATIGAGIDLSNEFTNFTTNVRELIDSRSGPMNTYDLGRTENLILLIFLVFTFLSMFGLLLSVLLVPLMIFIELYAYSAFSPIPMSTLFSSQRAIAISFLKTYSSVCIRGAVVMFGIHLSGAILQSDLLYMSGIALQGFLLVIIPIMQMTISIMVLQKTIKSAESFSRVLTGSGS